MLNARAICAKLLNRTERSGSKGTAYLSGQGARFSIFSIGMVWYGMVEVCEGAPVAAGGWVLTDRHGLAPCAANSLHRETISVNNMTGGTGTLGIA